MVKLPHWLTCLAEQGWWGIALVKHPLHGRYHGIEFYVHRVNWRLLNTPKME